MRKEEALALLEQEDILTLGLAADACRRQRFPDDTVTFIVDRNINYTNICTSECRFCAFFRRPGHPEGYVLTHEEVLEKVGETVAAGGTQILMQGGLHPDLPFSWYLDLVRAIKARYNIVIHSFSPTEILYFSRQSGLSIAEVLRQLREAGLDSLPGGGAEILVDEIRQRVSPKKISSGEWLDVMRQAQLLGFGTTATMVIGMGESRAQRLEHLEKIKRLQEETGGFRAFILWTYQPGNNELGGEKISSWEYLRTLAVARLYLDNIHTVQGSWVTQGKEIGQLTLAFGANDLGSVMLEENVVKAAGTSHAMNVEAMVRLIRQAGRRPAQRNTVYEIIKRFDDEVEV